MGSISAIYNPEFWYVKKIGKLAGKKSDETFVLVEIGEFDDYPSGGIITEVMTLSVYEKIVKKEYIVKKNFGLETPIRVYNKNGEEVSLLGNGVVEKERTC